MSATVKVILANKTFRWVRITRKSSTNEWVVKRIGSQDDGYFTDDVDDAIATARHMDKQAKSRDTLGRLPIRDDKMGNAAVVKDNPSLMKKTNIPIRHKKLGKIAYVGSYSATRPGETSGRIMSGHKRKGKPARSVDIKVLPNTGPRTTRFCAYLKSAGKTVLKLEADSSAYDRLLAASDLWARGASQAEVERAAGKHINT